MVFFRNFFFFFSKFFLVYFIQFKHAQKVCVFFKAIRGQEVLTTPVWTAWVIK